MKHYKMLRDTRHARAFSATIPLWHSASPRVTRVPIPVGAFSVGIVALHHFGMRFGMRHPELVKGQTARGITVGGPDDSLLITGINRKI